MSVNAERTLAQVRGAEFRGGLQQRVVGRAEGLTGPSWLGLLVEEGAARVETGDDEKVVLGSSFTWQPWNAHSRLVLAPGTVGFYFLVGATTLTNAVGHRAESRDLRELANRPISVPIPADGPVFRVLHNCFAEICAEIRNELSASRTMIESYLQILLIELWRHHSLKGEHSTPISPSRRIFSSFVELVDAHFRDRWTIGRYAETLGVSIDRLIDICSRMRGMTPKSLVDRRVLLEAQLLLESSSYTVEQIAYQLGFQTAAQFNRFFSRTSGKPPGRFRSERWNTSVKEATTPQLHEWP